MIRALTFAVLFGSLSCRTAHHHAKHPRTLSPSTDATVTEKEREVFAPDYFEVEWWNSLVKPKLLDFQPSETASPAIDPDSEQIIVCTRDGFVRCLSPVEGHIQWEKAIPGRCFAGATVVESIAYVPGANGSLYALHALTGEEIWKYDANEEIVTVPVLTPDFVLVASQNETLFAVERATGKWKWQHRRDPPSGFTVRGTATPVVNARQDLVYMAFADGHLVALNLKDGQAKWERNLSTTGGMQFLDADTTPALDESGLVYAASYQDGLYAMDAETGALKWTAKRTGISHLVLDRNMVLVEAEGKIAAYYTQSGQELWSLELIPDKRGGASTLRPPVLHEGLLIVPTSSGLVFVDPSRRITSEVWNPGKGVNAPPVFFKNRMYVLSNYGSVFSLRWRG